MGMSFYMAKVLLIVLDPPIAGFMPMHDAAFAVIVFSALHGLIKALLWLFSHMNMQWSPTQRIDTE